MNERQESGTDHELTNGPSEDGHEARLLRLVTRLDEAGSRRQDGTRFLIECVRAEFEAEEELMDRHGYPDLPRHRRRHEEILREADREQDEPSRHDRLSAWVRQHVLGMDWEYGCYLMRLPCRSIEATGKSFPSDSAETP
jgi:hemerythrin